MQVGAHGWVHVIDWLVLRQYPLARQLFDDHRERGDGHLFEVLRRQVVHGVRRDQDGDLSDVLVLGRKPRVQLECRGDDGRRGNAALFQIGGVVDTPRRTPASVTPGIDDGVHLSFQLIGDEHVGGEVL